MSTYRVALAESTDREAFALANSGLPGPRGNLELIVALADTTDESTLRRWADLSPADAPGNEPPVVLVAAGIVGLGDYLFRRSDVLGLLRDRARDPRWRVREAVAMALQRAGEPNPGAVIDLITDWITDPDPLVQRAVVAALCEPALLRDPAVAARVVDVLRAITASLVQRRDRRSESVRVLRQALGYGWSVALVGAPAAGKAAFERLLNDNDADVRWICARRSVGGRRQGKVGGKRVSSA